MESILPEIEKWFLPKCFELATFARNDTRLEGWFKGEMLVLLEQLKIRKIISKYERESNFYHGSARYQVDLEIRIGSENHLVELKAPCISQASRTPRDLNFYFRKDNVGLIRDLSKLNLLQNPNRWMLAFIYPKPTENAWETALKGLPNDLSNWRCVTELDRYPAHLFVSLWKG